MAFVNLLGQCILRLLVKIVQDIFGSVAYLHISCVK